MNSYTITEENKMNMDLHNSANPEEEHKAGTKMETFTKNIENFYRVNKKRFRITRNLLLLVLYLCYYGYAMYCNFGDEPSIRLTVLTALGLVCLVWMKLQKLDSFKSKWKALCRQVRTLYSAGKRPKIIQWLLYFVWTALFLVYIIVNVAVKNARNLIPLAGIAVYILLMVLLSNNRRRINWHCVFYGTILQCLFGLFVIKTSAGTETVKWFSDRLMEFLSHSDVGSAFVFGEKYEDHLFAMKVIPSIIVFVAVIQVLIYVGAVQFIVKLIGTPMAYILDVSAPEAINACANIFLGGAESGATILDYLVTMPTSRLFAISVCGFASVAGSNLIQYTAFGVPLKYLLAASAMSAPAALVCAKIVYPDTEEDYLHDNTPDITLITASSGSKYTVSETPEHILQDDQKSDNFKEAFQLNELGLKFAKPYEEKKPESVSRFVVPTSVGEAFVIGTNNGIKLVANIMGLLIVSLAIVELLNNTVQWLGDRVNIDITLNEILSYLFYPFVFVMGVDSEDCLRAGEFMGLRILSSPAVSYIYLGRVIYNRQLLDSYTAAFNVTLTYERADDIFLPNWNMTLNGGVFSERSEVIATYALCGFSSIPTVGVAFGLVKAFIPHRLPEITKLGFKLLVTGTVASYLTACVAGLLS